ncbi:Calcium-channel protein CCH1 like [Verticillium longisporum]|nr:Calcium-channel protein CCH1 like [Verticillium longisporum]
MRAMSQRVVNISSGEGELADHRTSFQRSRSPSEDRRRQQYNSGHMFNVDTSYPSHTTQHPVEKEPAGGFLSVDPHEEAMRLPRSSPMILVLIIFQTVLLTIEAAPNVFEDGNERPSTWGTTWIDYAMLGLFIVFTLELVARIIVSGFILNASEYSTIDRKRGVRAAVTDQYRALFQPQRQKSVKAPRQINLGPSAFARSLTFMQGQPVPQTVEEHQRYQLARRAFMRHSFNRLDFLAVVAYWITFVLAITGLESKHHMYVFRMISCLRILRLLAITNGTAIILRSLKKAAPLLVRIAFLIIFFWLLFAIIGVQSFKSSLSRHCVWLDPDAPADRSRAFVNEFQFCGGYLNQTSNGTEPWASSVLEDQYASKAVIHMEAP